MGDFKIGTTRPSVGDIHLGSRNVYEIYSGPTKVWPSCSDITPAEITLGGQIWQNKNSVVTAKSGGGNISIVTSPSAWNSAFSSNTPAAAYWGFNSANANYGLYYNIHCLSAIQPPTGFRIPDSTDLQTLVSSSYSGPSLSNNDCGLWPPNVNTIPDLNTAGWNGQGRGYLSVNSSGDVRWNPTVGSGSGASAMSNIWDANQPSGQGMYVFQLTYSGATTPPQINKQLPTYLPPSPPGLNNYGFNIRFVKDVVTLDLYDNDTQTGPTVSSITESILRPAGISGQSTFTRDAGSVVVPSGGGDVTLFQYLDNSTLPNITDAHFGVLPPNSTAIVGGAINVYPNANRNAFQLSYSLEWSNDNQGGVWSPDGFANRKTGTLTLPQGTWYLELKFFGEKNTSVGQIEYFTGISV
jgi:hypothetical protein